MRSCAPKYYRKPPWILLAILHARFNPRRLQLLEQRQQRQQEINSGKSHLGFLAHSAEIRSSDWQVAPIPENMRDRRVEITGPVERKMMINALNSWRQGLYG